MTFGAIVCAYSREREGDLTLAVESLLAQTRPIEEIVVVIDHNSELAAAAAAKWAQAPTVRVVENAHAKGLSGARNTGVSVVGSELVGFLDDDARAAPDWAEKLADRYVDEQVIGVGGAIDPEWPAAGGRPRWFPPEFDWVVGCSYTGMPDELAEVRNMIGANMSFRRDLFERVGGFTEGVGRVGKRPVGCEETELCIRAWREIERARILYDPAAKVIHRVPPERARAGYFRARCFAEGISKAQVARLAGAADALSSERTYTFKVLPRAILRGLGEALRGDFSGFARACAVALGPPIAAAGYLRGRLAPNVFGHLDDAADTQGSRHPRPAGRA